jgi:hypothetical protein
MTYRGEMLKSLGGTIGVAVATAAPLAWGLVDQYQRYAERVGADPHASPGRVLATAGIAAALSTGLRMLLSRKHITSEAVRPGDPAGR